MKETYQIRCNGFAIRIDHQQDQRAMARVFDGTEEVARYYRDTVAEAAHVARITAQSLEASNDE